MSKNLRILVTEDELFYGDRIKELEAKNAALREQLMALEQRLREHILEWRNPPAEMDFERAKERSMLAEWLARDLTAALQPVEE